MLSFLRRKKEPKIEVHHSFEEHLKGNYTPSSETMPLIKDYQHFVCITIKNTQYDRFKKEYANFLKQKEQLEELLDLLDKEED